MRRTAHGRRNHSAATALFIPETECVRNLFEPAGLSPAAAASVRTRC
ncbi:MAG: hypothetical protein AB1813_00795 [Verrucomicrobiota bacterium]